MWKKKFKSTGSFKAAWGAQMLLGAVLSSCILAIPVCCSRQPAQISSALKQGLSGPLKYPRVLIYSDQRGLSLKTLGLELGWLELQ